MSAPLRLERWTNDHWTDEQRTQLIWECRARPVLWNTSDKYYQFRIAQRALAWEEIAKALNIPSSSCKEMFRCLKIRLFHTHKKMLNKGKGLTHSYDWMLYKEMSFLLDHRKPTALKTTKKTTPTSTIQSAKQNQNVKTPTQVAEQNQNVKTPTQFAEQNQNLTTFHKPQTQLFLEIKKGIVEPVATTMIIHDLKPVRVGGKGQRVPVMKPPEINPSVRVPTQIIMPEMVPMKKETLQPTPGPSGSGQNTERFLDFLRGKLKTYSEGNRLQLQHEIIQALFRADKRESLGDLCDNRTEANSNDDDVLMPNISLNWNNICDNTKTEPHNYNFIESESDGTETYNENDELFEVYENKHDALLKTEYLEDDNMGFEDVSSEIKEEHDYAIPKEKRTKIKHEMTETDDEE